MRLHALPGAVFLMTVAGLTFAPSATATPPADAFCVILIEPSADFSLIRIVIDENTSLEERKSLWPTVDRDANGRISPVEKEAFRWAQTKTFPNQTELGIKAVALQPNAPYTKSPMQKAVYATTWRQVGHVFHHQEYRLPDTLTTSEELETQEVREFGFELEAWRSSQFTLSGGRNISSLGNVSAAPSYSDVPKPVIEYVVLNAPENWVVQRIEGFSYEGRFVLEPGTRSVDVPAFDTERPYNITFQNPELHEEMARIEGGPAPGLVVVLLGVVAAAWIGARKRLS